jgi:hypothetical protein
MQAAASTMPTIQPESGDSLPSAEPMVDPWGPWAPITFGAGYLSVPLARARMALETWWRKGIRRDGFVQKPISARFPEVLGDLLPLVMMGRTRELLVQCDQGRTAYFSNNARGTDAGSPISYLCTHLAAYGVAILNQPHTVRGREGIAGAVRFEYFGPRQTHFLNYIRSIAAAYDGRKWVFALGGQQQAFEDPKAYLARSVRDRFTSDLMIKYCRALGVSPYDQSFYGTEAILFEQTDPVQHPNVEVTLEQARTWLGLSR